MSSKVQDICQSVLNKKEKFTIQIASYILRRFKETDSSKYFSICKLNIIMYEMQGRLLANQNDFLFDEDFVACFKGPALPSVYKKYSHLFDYGLENYKADKNSEAVGLLPIEKVSLIDKTFLDNFKKNFQDFSYIFNKDSPWRRSYLKGRSFVRSADDHLFGTPPHNVIPKREIRDQYELLSRKVTV
jgi:uncharacterized phage-associated protein